MVNLKAVLRLLAFPLLWMGAVQLIFAFLSLFVFHDHLVGIFLESALTGLVLGGMLFMLLRREDFSRAGYRDALLFATLAWIISGVMGALPIVLVTHISFTDGVFESLSALTTTGATVLSGLDALPRSFLMYRQFLQWMGGLGIVIFVVAVLPMLNAGGLRLLKAETPGPIKDEKLSPRIQHTAHYLWYVYIGMTLVCALAYMLVGLSPFEALAHSFTTVSTGGFSTHDASLGYYNSQAVLAVANIFMLAGAISFALHFKVMKRKRISQYWRDEETRVFLLIVLSMAVLLAVYLVSQAVFDGYALSFSYSLFHIISFITSTGFAASDINAWPQAAAFFLLVAGYLGGCAGSTAGGNKIIRNIITFKAVSVQLRQQLHPRGVFTLKYQGQAVSDDICVAVICFMVVASFFTFLLTMLLMLTGLDFWSSFTAVAACLNVLGPGFGELGSNFAPATDTATWILSMAMVLGRLEYFTVLALLSRVFWRS